MKIRVWIVGCTALMVAACTDGFNTYTADGMLQEVPEGVLAIAATNQDLTAVRLNPDDGCYVYRYVGPVETTFLPLRTENGNPICTQTADATTTG
ncbi:hypothetical protein [Pacificibacter marinus]|uniref:Lipoprotein n=1 Tax=Pacificibacter marinus TaxID=658057 RepID=A0A1Y5R6Z2_9RHOB|nr:hypothetical protein [Pacificibacter marinus]SEK29122.1 hypothetical protein SAMN04488032_101621 [Pacificibacter marinus]SLN10615.1 hypothetical protein PAM7971_00026 [Pacificibacter marinus]